MRRTGVGACRGTADRPRAAAPSPSALLWTTFLLCAAVVASAPRRAGEEDQKEIARAVVFLTRFGYLPDDDRTGNLLSDDEFRSAVAAAQRFGGLEPTGRIDAATRALMRARRCGVPDFAWSANRIRRYAIQGQKWPRTHITWSVRNEGGSSTEQQQRRREVLGRAFGVWSAASTLTFQEVLAAEGADIVVSFLSGVHGDGYPFDGAGSVLAHAFFPGEGIGGDAHFDAEERWLPEQPTMEDDGVNLFAVAAHEIGHSLGLSHSATPGSLMFPYYQLIGDGLRFRLPRDDAEGIRHLYGVKHSASEVPSNLPDLASTTPVFSTTTSHQETTTPIVRTTTPDPHKKKKKKKLLFQTTTTTPQPLTTTAGTQSGTVDSSQAPDICQSSIDAISLIRREIFVFKGKFFWRLHMNRTLRAGYPVSVDRFWYDLPPDIDRIDALYERPSDTKIVFFSGRRFWLFSANRVEPGYPKPLTELGLPEDLDHVDAALVWGHNGKTYLFGGERYWKLDEEEGRVELDYPRSITAWRGIPTHIDAAFQWMDGNTYFFKNTKFWKFVDIKMRVEKKSPSEIAGFWFQCPSKTMESASTTAAPLDSSGHLNNSSTFHIMYLHLFFLIHLLILCLL